MSKITDIIFKGEKHYITSKYGYRDKINTSAGTTSTFHNGTDYGTHLKKLPQYAIEDGTVYSCGTASDGAKYVKITYPRINKRLYHWHLDSISVKKGDKVKKYTKIGTTGETGKATGIHLHLCVVDLSNGKYIDPEVYAKSYTPPGSETVDNTNYKFKIGDEVIITGKLYKSSNADSPSGSVKNKATKITRIAKGTKHPYNTTGDLGWMNETDISFCESVSNETFYTVKKGDTLSGIASKHKMSYKDLYAKNKSLIDSENKKRGVATSKMWVYPGQKLVIK